MIFTMFSVYVYVYVPVQKNWLQVIKLTLTELLIIHVNH